MFSERYGWKPIDSAPVDQNVALIVTDGGKPYLLNGPLRNDLLLALQLRFLKVSESMGNHDSKIVDAGGVD
jgi:hypothetical protein